MKLIVMVCTANACRSPMAEGLLRGQFRGRYPDVRVISAGTLASLGAATPEGVTAAAELGVDLRRHRSQQITAGIVAQAALVIAMTREHARWLRQMFPAAAAKVRTLGELARGAGGPDIADPIGQDLEVYRRTARQIQELLREAEPEILQTLQ